MLDIAGGSGRFAIPLFKYSQDITVIDINQEAIELLNKEQNKIKTIHTDFIEVELKEKYDLILCIEALSYFEDMTVFFEKIEKLLTPNGQFIFTFVNTSSWRYFFRRLNKKITGKKLPQYNEISFKNLKQILKEKQFTIEKTEGMNWIPLPISYKGFLVTFFAFIERKLKLYKWINQSPLLLISVKKQHNDSH